MQVKSNPPPGLAGAIHSVLPGAEVAKAQVAISRFAAVNNILKAFILIPHEAPVKEMNDKFLVYVHL
ncbi:protein of unknown function [Xenorhabdus poinarii G6]|uniref:Uncharacterized protein n=1 Tax=Xenorhabdus poinarii G6 TaxID=1354304 RepID=A0A068R0N8_9GAMM|nr:protein of unknown function [Xenorhabdus poinarii G6]